MGREKVSLEALEFPRPSRGEVLAAVERSLPMRAPGSTSPRARAFAVVSHDDWLTICGAALNGTEREGEG